MNDLTTNIPDAACVSVPAPPLPSAPVATPWKAPSAIGQFLLLLAILFLPPLVYADDGYRIGQFAKIAALALLALSIDLIWGYTGLLSLGQGLYFGIGAYAVAYSLSLQQAALGEDKAFVAAPDMALPNYMMFSRFTEVPEWIAPLINIYLALAVAIFIADLALPPASDSSRFVCASKGVYFSLITQALILDALPHRDSSTPTTPAAMSAYGDAQQARHLRLSFRR